MSLKRKLLIAGGILLIVIVGTGAGLAAKRGRFMHMYRQPGFERGTKGFEGGPGFGFDRFGKGDEKVISPETQQLLDELRTAREANDSAKVTELRDKIAAQRLIDQDAKAAEYEKALTEGYDAWKAYATQHGFPEKMMQKITPENFASFVELQATQKKMRELEKTLNLFDVGGAYGQRKPERQ
ncbi:MAG: hypothetical protein V1908_02675 [Candidatus Peregrinibacteria bacterium]